MGGEILVNIEAVSGSRSYWFVRTDNGQHFETFLRNDFIGINWNDITYDDLIGKTEIEVKSKISKSYGYDLDTRNGKQKTTDTYHKLLRFLDLKLGDVVVIPSCNTDYLAFGLVADASLYSEASGTKECVYAKRRKIRWLTGKVDINSLDPTFYKIKKSRHAISNIDLYDYYVDSILYDVYIKDDYSHYVLKITKHGEINLLKFADALTGLHDVMSLVNSESGLKEDVDAGSIRVYLQSPGLFNIKHVGVSLLLSAALIGSNGCRVDNQPVQTKEKIDSIYRRHGTRVDSARSKLRAIGVEL
jgi:restriction system protein